MNGPSSMIRRILGLGSSQTVDSEVILQLKADHATAESVEKQIQKRLNQIIAQLPSVDCVPMMVPIENMLRQAGEELLATGQRRAEAASVKKTKPKKTKSEKAQPSGTTDFQDDILDQGRLSEMLTSYDTRAVAKLTEQENQMRRRTLEFDFQRRINAASRSLDSMLHSLEQHCDPILQSQQSQPAALAPSPPTSPTSMEAQMTAETELPTPGQIVQLAKQYQCSPGEMQAYFQQFAALTTTKPVQAPGTAPDILVAAPVQKSRVIAIIAYILLLLMVGIALIVLFTRDSGTQTPPKQPPIPSVNR